MRLQSLWPIWLGLGFFAAASAGIELTRQAGDIASFWPPNAIMLAVLLGWPSLPRLSAFATCAFANILANMVYGDSLLVASAFALANMIEVGAPLAFLHWIGRKDAYLSNLKNASTLALSLLIGVSMASPLGAGVVALAYGAPWAHVMVTWFAADMAGMLIFTPAILRFGQSEHGTRSMVASTRSRGEVILAGSAFASVFAIVFVSQNYASPYLFIPIILWLATRFGLALTAIACAVIAVTAAITTVAGEWNIFSLSHRSIGEQILDLQIFIAIVVVSFLPLTILMGERARLVDELRMSEQRYSLAVRGSGAGIWTWEATTDELLWSDRLKEMVDITDDCFTPDVSSFLNRLHPDDHDLVVASRRQHLVSKEPYDIECRLRKEDGSYIWIHNRGQAVWDEFGKPVLMAGSAEDITARKTAEDKSARYAKELERSNQELDGFAHIASHDLKEPLRAICNHAGILLEDYRDQLEEDGRRRLHRLIQLGRRMERVVADLLHFARLGQGDRSIETVDLNFVIADIEASLAETLRERNAKIVQSTPLPAIRGHPPHLTALFQNLISNGTKYNDSEERVIETGLALPEQMGGHDGFSTIFIRDNGIGIEDQFHDDVFRIFKRLNSEQTYGAGTGAGLSFVKKIVENLDGKIWLTSTLGKGTTFFVTLPTSANEIAVESESRAA